MPQNNKISFFSGWNKWYVLVIVALVAEIIFFTWFTQYFS